MGKTKKIFFSGIKSSDNWQELMYDLKFNDFKKQHPNLKEEDLADLFYTKVVKPVFEYGEYGNIEIEVDENLNIVSGRIIPYKH